VVLNLYAQPLAATGSCNLAFIEDLGCSCRAGDAFLAQGFDRILKVKIYQPAPIKGQGLVS
jgi:hypothetical protein